MKTKIIIIGLLVCMLLSLCSCSKSYKDYDGVDAKKLGDQTIDIINNKNVRNTSLSIGENYAHHLMFEKYEKKIYIKDIYYDYEYIHIDNQEKIYYKESLVSSRDMTKDDFMNLYIHSFISIDLDYVEKYTYEITSYRNLWGLWDQHRIEHKYVFENEYCFTFDFMGKKYEINNVILKLTNDTDYSSNEYYFKGYDIISKEYVSYSFLKEETN